MGMAIFSEDYRKYYRIMGKKKEFDGDVHPQMSTIPVPVHHWGWDHIEEVSSNWLTHPDFTDSNGDQLYYQLATRRPALVKNDLHTFGLRESKTKMAECRSQNHPSYPQCIDPEDPRVLETGDCECCNPTGKELYTGCALNPKDACSHVKYTGIDGTQKRARRWCPESLEEMQEVYAYAQNDVDPKFLKDDIWADYYRLSKWDMLARWWVYANTFNWFQVFIPGDQEAIENDTPAMTEISVYDRDDIALGVHRKQYELAANQNQMKRAHACYNGVDSDAISDWNWKPDPSEDATVLPTLDEDEESQTYGHVLDWGSRDGARPGLLGEEANFQSEAYKHGMALNFDGIEMCMILGPQLFNEERNFNNYTVQLRWTMKQCGDNQKFARPMCVVKASEIPNNDPDQIKANAINMKSGGPLFDKYMKRQTEVKDTLWWWGMWIAVPQDLKYWFFKTYGFCLFFFCFCHFPCCWEGWICGKGGVVWESFLCAPCKLFCYGGFCGWRCLPNVKRVEAKDKVEKERRVAVVVAVIAVVVIRIRNFYEMVLGLENFFL